MSETDRPRRPLVQDILDDIRARAAELPERLRQRIKDALEAREDDNNDDSGEQQK